MRVTRREFSMMAGAALFAGGQVSALPAKPDVTVVLAPSNLGLSPHGGQSGGQPGTWRAPQVLMGAGLAEAVSAAEVMSLERPKYEFGAQSGTRIRNGQSIRAFSLQLSEKVRGILQANRFPVVIGGDCSILLGCLYGARLAGGRGLVHVDGHTDFYHPANYDARRVLGAAAGMDLALASGRGEPLLTEWPQVGTPLASDADIIQVGDRDAGFTKSSDNIPDTEIVRFTVQRILADGIDAAARRVVARLETRGLARAWVHVDFDVLSARVMPAVDSPGTPGFDFAQLGQVVGALCASGRIAGVDFGIYDPERDSGLRYARPLVRCIADGIGRRVTLS